MNLNKWVFNNDFRHILEDHYSFNFNDDGFCEKIEKSTNDSNTKQIPYFKPLNDDSIRIIIDSMIIDSIETSLTDDSDDIVVSDGDSYLKRCGC